MQDKQLQHSLYAKAMTKQGKFAGMIYAETKKELSKKIKQLTAYKQYGKTFTTYKGNIKWEY